MPAMPAMPAMPLTHAPGSWAGTCFSLSGKTSKRGEVLVTFHFFSIGLQGSDSLLSWMEKEAVGPEAPWVPLI